MVCLKQYAIQDENHFFSLSIDIKIIYVHFRHKYEEEME